MNSPSTDGIQANPDALNAIVKAGESYYIVASQDIVDVRGVKLWAKGQPVSAALQQRLLERKLLHPMEACLQAENGVTLFNLHDELQRFLDDGSTLSQALKPWASPLVEQVKAIPLHAVAQLLLTTAVATRPQTLPHAVQAMALAGAMASRDGSLLDIRLAMLGGLLHDIGEVYIQPAYLNDTGPLDLVGYKNIAAHPRAAQLLLSTTTDYPQALCRAIGEHHERTDGSGYPARVGGDKLSPLGRLLAVVEVTMGIMRAPQAPLTRASFALRVIPGEFDSKWTGLVCDAARTAGESLQSVPSSDRADFGLPMQEIEKHAQRAELLESTLFAQHITGPVADIVSLAQQRLTRLRVAWNELGIWGIDTQELQPNEQFEIYMANRELQQRLRELQRECLLLGERLEEPHKRIIAPLWEDLFKTA